jgi:putative tRNA adenosine deaminase-associated protein
MAEQLDEVDFALAAYRRDGAWVVGELAHDLPGDVDEIAEALRRFAGPEGAVAMIGLDEDYFLLLRVDDVRTRLLLSDAGAADEWDLAVSALDFLGDAAPDDEDDEDIAGDLDLLADLGLSGDDLEELLDDGDAYPDELLSDVARAVGFGELFDDALGLAPA